MTRPDDNAMPIGVLSRRTGCNVETIRYYERIGIMPAPPRTEGGSRRYRADHLKRLNFIRRSRQLGFSLEDIRGLLGFVDGGDYSCEEVRAVAQGHLEEVRRKVADLERIEEVMREMVARCDAGVVPQCPVIEALFAGDDQPSG